MTVLLNVIAPIFAVAALGYAAARFRVLRDEGVNGLVVFVFDFAIPVLLFRTLATIELPEHVPWSFLIAYYGGSASVYALGMVVGRLVFDRPLDEATIFGMSAAFCNTVFIGLPVILTAFGPEATLPLFLIISLHAALFMPLTVGLIHGSRGAGFRAGDQARAVVGAIAANPIVVGLALGAASNLAGLTIPAPVDRAAELVGSSAVPCALFAMGASLTAFHVAGEVKPALVLASLKLVVHPALVWAVGSLVLGLGGIWLKVAVVMAAMPTGVNAYLFGSRYGAAEGVAAGTVLVGSVASVATISALLLAFAA
jgi:malonate transporter